MIFLSKLYQLIFITIFGKGSLSLQSDFDEIYEQVKNHTECKFLLVNSLTKY